jgi:hypothetical protein
LSVGEGSSEERGAEMSAVSTVTTRGEEMGESGRETALMATSRRLYGVSGLGSAPRVSGVLRSRCLRFLARFLPSSLPHYLADASSTPSPPASLPPPTPSRCPCHLRLPCRLQCRCRRRHRLWHLATFNASSRHHYAPRALPLYPVRRYSLSHRLRPSHNVAAPWHVVSALREPSPYPVRRLHPSCALTATHICTPHRLVPCVPTRPLHVASSSPPLIPSMSPMDARSRRFLTRHDRDDDGEDKDDVTTTT